MTPAELSRTLIEQLCDVSARYLAGELTADDYLHRCVIALAYAPERGRDLKPLAEVFVRTQRSQSV